MSKFIKNNVVMLYKITDEKKVLTATRFEFDYHTMQLVSKTYLSDNVLPKSFLNYDPNKLNIKKEPAENVLKIFPCKGDFYNGHDCSNDQKPICGLNIPTMIRCQNCEWNFPTKYQYQRHQCEFNAEKVILKADADHKDIEKGVRIKYDCSTCGKHFVSKNNLDRHEATHENSQSNICEYCNKQFVSENRLRIHKENHCKKAGDISKFYRSDVTVWKCRKCHEVFSSIAIANVHVESCIEDVDIKEEEVSDGITNEITTENKNVDKILTEILLQCEFCNRTYTSKALLLAHMKSHTTAKNYECVNCNETFDSFAVATQHWMRKCSEFANLFYLPKLTYCEWCDRTFKSHELLYTHKIKKKHYTPKKYVLPTVEEQEKSIELRSNFNELIQDVLKTLSMPVTTSNNTIDCENEALVVESTVKCHDSTLMQNETCPEDGLVTEIKLENSSDCNDEIVVQEPETSNGKKKRGRKRRLLKQPKAKRACATVEEGHKYQCERCIKVFDAIVDLENHREKEHAANFSCEECGQILHSARALLVHSRAHKSLKPYVCDTCGRSYSQTSHLWQHMRFHQGIKPFACPHEGCEARYTIRPDLKDHIRKVHTRERPFKCNVCNKCFLTGSVYYQHRLIHTNDRRYGCDVCQRRFFRADALNNHKRIHTDERPYACSMCGREFRQKGDRNKHIRTQHPGATV